MRLKKRTKNIRKNKSKTCFLKIINWLQVLKFQILLRNLSQSFLRSNRMLRILRSWRELRKRRLIWHLNMHKILKWLNFTPKIRGGRSRMTWHSLKRIFLGKLRRLRRLKKRSRLNKPHMRKLCRI